MNKIILILLFITQIVSCSKTNSSQIFPKIEEEPQEIIDLGNLNVSPIDGLLPIGNLDFGNVLYKEKTIQSLVITNQAPTPFNINLSDTVIQSNDFIIEKNTCVAPLQRRRTCTITVAITNKNPTSIDINAIGTLTVKGVVYSLSALLKVNEDSVGDPISGVSVQPTFLNFGKVNPGESKDLTIRVTNLTLPSISIPVTSSSNSSVSLVRNSCLNRQLLRRRFCFISYRYNSPSSTQKFLNTKLSFIANNKLTFSAETSLDNLTNPNFLSILPNVPSIFELMSQPQVLNRTIEFINQGNVVLPTPINVVTSSDGIEVVSHTCSSGLRPGTKCSVNFNINSVKLEKGNQTYLLRLQSSSLASANLNIVTDISNNNYSLSVGYTDPQLAMQVSQLKIYKNNQLCASDCLDSYSPGDIAKIEVLSTTAVGVDNFIVEGSFSNLEKPISRIAQFTFGSGDVDVEIILGVGPVQVPPIDPTPAPVPNPIGGGISSVRCYNKSGLDRLSASLKLEKASEIPSLIYSGINPKEADDLVVDAAENPTFHGWAFYQGEVHQCYNFSISQSIETPQTCKERLAAWGISNDIACNPPQIFGSQQQSGSNQELSGLCEKYGIGCGLRIDTGLDSAVCKIFGYGCGGNYSIPNPKVNLCSDLGLGCNGDTIFPTGPNSVSCKVFGICGGDLPNLPNVCKLYGLCLGKIPVPPPIEMVKNFCNTVNLCSQDAICSNLGIGCKGGPLIGPDSVVCKMFGSQCDGMPEVKVNLCNTLGLNCGAVGINSVTCLMTGLGCGSGNGFLLSPCAGFGIACGDDIGEIVNNVGDAFVEGINDIGRPMGSVINSIGEVLPDVTDQQIIKVGLDVGTVGLNGIIAGGGLLLDGYGGVAGVITSQDTIDAVTGVLNTINPSNYSEELTEGWKELDDNILGPAEKIAITGLENVWSESLAGADVIGEAIKDASFPKIKTCVPSVKCKCSVKCKKWKCKTKCECTVKTCVKASTGDVARAIGANTPKFSASGCAFPSICGGISAGWVDDVVTYPGQTLENVATSGWKAVQDVGEIGAGAVAVVSEGVGGVVSYVKDDVLQGVRFDADEICQNAGICGATMPTTCQAFNICPKEEEQSPLFSQMCNYLNLSCPSYKLKINYSDSQLASQLLSVSVFRNGQPCSGNCLNSFKPQDNVVVAIDPPTTVRVTDVIANGTTLNNEILIVNGVSFQFQESDVTLDVQLNYNMFSYLNFSWGVNTLQTQTRFCQTQPSNSSGGIETLSTLTNTWVSCSQFSCNYGFINQSGTCIPNTATITVQKNVDNGVVFDASFAKIKCEAGCLSDSKTYIKGDTIVLMAFPNNGYTVSSWNNCPYLVAPDKCLISNISTNINTSVSFSQINTTSPCTLSDSQLNGWTITNATIPSGTKVGSDISNCGIQTCSPNYLINSSLKTCQATQSYTVLNQSFNIANGYFQTVPTNINTMAATINGQTCIVTTDGLYRLNSDDSVTKISTFYQPDGNGNQYTPVVFQNKMYFPASVDSSTGTAEAIWSSDCTTGGTGAVAGTNGQRPSGLTVAGNFVYYRTGGANSFYIYKLDASNNSSIAVSQNSTPFKALLNQSNPTLLFQNFENIYSFNGSFGVMIKQINPTSGYWGSTQSDADAINDFAVSNNKMIFTATDGTSGREPWVTDGTNVGTVRIADIVSGSGSSSPIGYNVINGKVLFLTNTIPVRVYSYDPVLNVSNPIYTFTSNYSINASYFIKNVVKISNTKMVFAIAKDSDIEVWETDGSNVTLSNGIFTELSKNINQGGYFRMIEQVFNANGTTFMLVNFADARGKKLIKFNSQSVITVCTNADTQSNGWDISKALSVTGVNIDSDVSACIVNSCIESYIVSMQDKKCIVNLDPESDNIINNAEFNMLLNDAASGYVSSTITLDPSKTYEFDSEVVIPAGVTLQGPSSSQKIVIRKKNEIINGIDKTVAQTIKNQIQSAIPLIMFDANGDVIGYNGVQSGVGLNAALQTAMSALTSYYEAFNVLDPMVVTLGSKKYRFDVNTYGNRCKATNGESFICPSGVTSTTVKFTPFYQEILNTPTNEFSGFNKNTVVPLITVSGSNVTLKNLDLACPNDVPYLPVHEMVNIGNPKVNGEPPTFNGAVLAPGFNASGIFLNAASNVRIENVKIQHCNLGIYSLNSKYVNILNNEIFTNVKEQEMHNVSTKELGDLQNPWKYRFHGVNGIRIHGTQDRDFLIKGNIIGTSTSGAQKGIHIHGTSLSNRDHDDDGVADLPMQGFVSDDQGLTALGPYADRSDESSMRKNFKIISNTVRGHHTAGIDFEGDQLNIEIRSNTVSNISDKYYVAAAQGTIDGGVGIKILTEVAPLNIYNLFSSGTAYSLDFVGSAKNVLIQSNTVTDTALGIYLSNTNNDLTKNFAFDNFPLTPVTPIKDNYNCSLTSMFSNCSNQVSIKNNIIRRSNHNSIVQASHPSTLALQSHCLFINGMVGVEVTNNTFDTCNVADFNYLGQPAAINVTNSKKVYFLSNPISIDASTEIQRQSLGTLTDTTRNRYFAYRFNGTANNISIISRLQTSETVIVGCSNTVDSNCLAKYNFKSSVGNIFGTQGTNYTNELQTSNPSPYMFIPSIELNNINENP